MSGLGSNGAAPLRWNDSPAVPPRTPPQQELEPLIQPVSQSTVGRFLAMSGIFLLVLSWCVLDNWNEVVSGSLFQIGVADGTSGSHGKPQYFKYPLTLTFLEILFMFIAFSGLWFCTSTNREQDIDNVKSQIFSAPWSIIVVTHLFSTFWLQALMMPSQVMSTAFFASTRAAEVPLVAFTRALTFREPFGGHRPQIIGFVTAANMLLFFSYLQMEGCICIFEGHGILLSGLALYAIYFLLLAMPAMNTVGQETIMTVGRMNPLLMLALQNGFATIVLSPVLLLEDVSQAFSMIYHYEEVSLLVLWLCIQACAFAFVTVLLVRKLDSFWAVALHSMRVVYWWTWQLVMFYVGSNSLLSVSHPKTSGWSFGMMAGLGLLAYAMYADTRFTSASVKRGSSDANASRLADQDDAPKQRV